MAWACRLLRIYLLQFRGLTALVYYIISPEKTLFTGSTMVSSPNVILDEQRTLKNYIKYDIFQTEACDVQ